MIPVAGMVLVAGCQSTGQEEGGYAYPSSNLIAGIVGSYKGCIMTGKTEYPGTTTFLVDDDGVISGKYELVDRGTIVRGELSEFGEVGPRQLKCRWKDKHGEGDLNITFSRDLSSFDGLWSSDRGRGESAWNGEK